MSFLSNLKHRLRAFLGQDKIADPRQMAEETYKSLREHVANTEKSISEGEAAQRKLEKQLLSSNEKIGKEMERLLQRNSGANSVADNLAPRTNERQDIEEKLAQQKQLVVTLRNRLSDLEEQMENANTKRMVLLSSDAVTKATKEMDRAIADRARSELASSIRNYEEEIAAREAAALGFIESLAKVLNAEAIEKWNIEDLDRMVPVLPHILEQLSKAIDQIAEIERDVEKTTEKNQTIFDTWTQRAQTAIQDNNTDLANMALARGKQFAIATNELTSQRNALRRQLQQLRDQQQEFDASVKNLSARMERMRTSK